MVRRRAWSEDLADSYLALGRVDNVVRTIGNATRCGYADGAEMLCELAEKLMRSGHEPQLGIELPAVELLDRMPEWSAPLH